MPSTVGAGELVASVDFWLRRFLSQSQSRNHANQNGNADKISHQVSPFCVESHQFCPLAACRQPRSIQPEVLNESRKSGSSRVLIEMVDYLGKAGKVTERKWLIGL
jgi:hypothetical protein